MEHTILYVDNMARLCNIGCNEEYNQMKLNPKKSSTKKSNSTNQKFTHGAKTWHKDDLGWYWSADQFRNGVKVGSTGNWHLIGERKDQKPVDK